MKILLVFLMLIGGVPPLPAQSPLPQPLAFRIGSFRFDRPEGWSYSRPTDGVRAAQLEKKSGGVPLLITFTRFPPGSGGSVQANVDRWKAQFFSTEAPAEIFKPEGTALPLTTVKLAGTLRGALPVGL